MIVDNIVSLVGQSEFSDLIAKYEKDIPRGPLSIAKQMINHATPMIVDQNNHNFLQLLYDAKITTETFSCIRETYLIWKDNYLFAYN